MLSAGNPSEFSLSNQDGKSPISAISPGTGWSFTSILRRHAGCTIQGRSFTATKDDFDSAGIKVVA